MMSNASHRPRVSIGLPVYNGERYIAETLDSLLAQTFQDFELIICDNASDDGTEQICRRYAADDSRIRYVRNQTNVGAPKNYRRAFELSSAEYFRWANSDDVFGPLSIACCVEVLDREPSAILAYPKTKLIDEHGEVISEYEDNLNLQQDRASDRFIQLFARLRKVNVIYGLMRSDALKKTTLIGNFIGADTTLLAELSLYGKFWEIPEFLFYRRMHPKASSSYNSDELQKFYDPKSKRRFIFTHYRHFLAHYRSVARAPIGIHEKVRLGCFLARKAIWRRELLVSELVEGIRRKILQTITSF
jgi:glycosyltransferase involved in cell wall biosynthesis